jgi:hypothetical protein
MASSKILTPPLWCKGRTHSLGVGGEGGGGSIFWKRPDTALYSTYVSALWFKLFLVSTANPYFVLMDHYCYISDPAHISAKEISTKFIFIK